LTPPNKAPKNVKIGTKLAVTGKL